jgi:hypothetical protein
LEDLKFEDSRMWKLRKKLVPGINGALGPVKKGLDQNFQLLTAHRSANVIQKITLIITAHSIR